MKPKSSGAKTADLPRGVKWTELNEQKVAIEKAAQNMIRKLARTGFCCKCKGRHFSVETGLSFESEYKNGKYVKTTRIPITHGIFCLNCGQEKFTPEEEKINEY